jgi:hypothetical protein
MEYVRDMCGPRYKPYYWFIPWATDVIYLEAGQSSRHTLLQTISACERCRMAMHASWMAPYPAYTYHAGYTTDPIHRDRPCWPEHALHVRDGRYATFPEALEASLNVAHRLGYPSSRRCKPPVTLRNVCTSVTPLGKELPICIVLPAYPQLVVADVHRMSHWACAFCRLKFNRLARFIGVHMPPSRDRGITALGPSSEGMYCRSAWTMLTKIFFAVLQCRSVDAWGVLSSMWRLPESWSRSGGCGA